MSWILLVVAGLLETAWAVGLKHTEGFTRPLPSLLTAAGVALSLFLLAQAARELPIGTAYAVWVGIGATGAAVLGVVLYGEPLSPGRVVSLVGLVLSLIGLKLTAAS